MENQQLEPVLHPAFVGPVDVSDLFNSEPLAIACADIDGLLRQGDTCVLITGEQGVGKTAMLDKLYPILDRSLVTARVSAKNSNSASFLGSVLKSFGFDEFEGHTEEFRHILRAFIRHEATHSNKPVIMVDDAQDMQPDVLFELNSLVSMRINGVRAVNLLLIGQPNCEDALDIPELPEVWRSITVTSQFKGLCEVETAGYLSHRLQLAGMPDVALFPPEVIPSVFRYTGGIPSLINRLSSVCLQKLQECEASRVDTDMVKEAIAALSLTPRAVRSESERNKRLIADAAVGKDNAPRVVLSYEGRLLGVYTLDKERVSIGRHHFNEICIDSTAISRHHAQLLVNGKGVYLIDLNSTNGTFVNFKPVEQKLLRNSDIIAVGKHRLKFTEARNTRPVLETEPESAEDTLLMAGNSLEDTHPPIKRVK